MIFQLLYFSEFLSTVTSWVPSSIICLFCSKGSLGSEVKSTFLKCEFEVVRVPFSDNWWENQRTSSPPSSALIQPFF